jgi:hypothetical protein
MMRRNAGRESEPGWDAEITDDVKEECGKYGAVQHAWVDKNSQVRVIGFRV